MGARAQLSLWALMIALSSCWINIVGGVICFWYPDALINAIYSISIGVVFLPFWWPCEFMGPLLQLFQWNFYFSGVFCLGLSVYTFFQVPTACAGLALVSAGIIFIIAGVRGEKGLSTAQLTGGARI